MADIGIDVPLTKPEVYTHVTDSAITKYHFERHHGLAPSIRQLDEIEERVMHHYKGKPTANKVKGAVQFLNEVMNEGIPYCIATGSFYTLALEKLHKANLPFDERLLATSKDGDSREAILASGIKRAKQVFAAPVNPVVVSFGDGIWDLKTARNMQINFVGIGHKIDYLKSNGANHCFKDYSEIDCRKVISLFR